ncbi:cytochrome c oxidase subunit II [Virgibacillus profundi]|uniref:Cytochrome c oxidase subunit 2 n=1 Tax=Virgibacillus profundi TaxID=2024555 RepID=A0A2A2IJU2_9BACI|nr:cytochrome c oxidase subunit II [Virgibacillus profundi]PAV31420.1 cytochrome c oxidase subunit II [Virgibacillus profundi]PXY55606.1 cytochrome c oxidase subunit II [Virgibacillus profundi]
MKKLGLLLSLLLLTGCNIAVLEPKSETASDQAFLIVFSFWLMMIVVLTVFVLFVRFVYKYRYTDNKKDFMPKDVKGNKKLEATWIILPILLLAVLAVPTIAITYEQSPVAGDQSDHEGTHIYVTAQQFSWTFEHETGKEVQNDLVIPEGESIILHLNSKDVIHSFWVPHLGGKVDVLPGEELVYVIENPEIGTYQGKCAEYCGIQHAKMTFEANVVSIEDYERYVNED